MTTLLEKIIQQNDLAIKLKNIKEQESKLRMEICQELLKDASVGVHKFQFDYVKVKATKKLNYSLDQSGIQEALELGLLSEDETKAVKTKYELSLSVYKGLEDTPNLDEYITVTDAMPTLEIEYV